MALRIAVYGSLRKGMGNHRLLDNNESVKLSTERVSIPFDMLDLGGYPGLIMSDHVNDMIVEIYEVSPKVYKSVEWLEGYPSFYNRQPIETSVGTADIYYLNHEGATFRYGDRMVNRYDNAFDWVKHLQRRRNSELNSISQD